MKNTCKWINNCAIESSRQHKACPENCPDKEEYKRDILIKEVFDEQYEIYRNLLNKPAIPLEARDLIFTCIEQYADRFKDALKELMNEHSFSSEPHVQQKRNYYLKLITNDNI